MEFKGPIWENQKISGTLRIILKIQGHIRTGVILREQRNIWMKNAEEWRLGADCAQLLRCEESR